MEEFPRLSFPLFLELVSRHLGFRKLFNILSSSDPLMKSGLAVLLCTDYLRPPILVRCLCQLQPLGAVYLSHYILSLGHASRSFGTHHG